MALTNDFLPFAAGSGANVLSQSDYAALAAVANGFVAGTAQSAQLNKVWRQSSILSAVLAQFIVNNSGQSAVDDGSTASLLANLTGAIRALTRQQVVLADTGAANAYAAANSPVLAALPAATGLVQRVSIANTNTGTATYAPDGLAAKPIVGMGLTALQGGEMPAKGVAALLYVVASNVNSGNGAWVLIECTGGAQQVPAATQAQHAVQLGQVGHGQCRLAVASGTSLKLSPYNGNNIIINGVPQQIPGAGVTIANTGLTASTLYYAYVFMNAGVMALELSTTGHSTGATGIEQKIGDATRTLVGMIYTNGATQFSDSQGTRFLLNWFNRRQLDAIGSTAGANGFSSTTMVEITSLLRVMFLTWADEVVEATSSGAIYNSTSGALTSTCLFMDGLAFGNLSECAIPGQAIDHMPVTSTSCGLVSEGLHTVTMYGKVSAGSAALQQSPVCYAKFRG